MRQNAIILCLTLIISGLVPLTTNAQVYTYKMDSLYSESKKDLRLIKNLNKAGIRVLDSTIQITNLKAWKNLLSKNKYRLSFNGQVFKSKVLRKHLVEDWSAINYVLDIPDFEKFLSRANKRSKRFEKDTLNLFTLTSFPQHFDLGIYKRRKPITTINFDKHQAGLAAHLPQLEDAPCTPFNRCRKYELTLDDLENIHVPFYTPQPVERSKKRYTLTFEHNSSTFDPIQVNAIIGSLKDDNLTIARADIKAYASVEGFLEINERLQEERAAVMLSTFEKVNDGMIEASVTVTEDWELFYKQLHQLNFHDWDSLSQDSVKSLLTNDNIRNKYEPYLAQQRRADLELTLHRRLSKEERIDFLLRDFKRHHDRLLALNTLRSTHGVKHTQQLSKQQRYLLGELMAIKRYTMDMVASNQLDFERVSHLWHECEAPELNLTDFFELKKRFISKKSLSNIPVRDIIMRAHPLTLTVNNPNRINTHDPNFKRAMQVMDLSTQLMEQEILPKEFILQLDYPNDLAFTHLRAAKTNFMIANHVRPVAINTRELIAKYNYEQDRLYYGLVKEASGVTFEVHNGIKVMRITPRNDFYYQFDLLEFINYNVHYWKPKTDKLFDPEITEQGMRRLLSVFFSVNQRVCPDDVFQIANNYHLKHLHYADAFDRIRKETWRSYEFLENYYTKRFIYDDPTLSSDVINTLLYMNQYHFYNRPGRVALDFMNEVSEFQWQNMAGR